MTIHIQKKCSQCEQEKSTLEFYKKKGCKHGVMSVCKVCWKSQVKTFQTLNQNLIKEKQQQRYSDNKEAYSKRNKVAYLKDQDYRKLKQTEYNIENKDKRKLYNAQPHIKQRDNEYMKVRKQNDPIFKLSQNMRASISMRIREINSTKDLPTLSIIGLNTWEDFKHHLENQFTEGMNWSNYGNKVETDWSIDHFTPISSANTLGEVKKLNHYSNLRPMWHLDNIKKRDKII
jgi:hypothetical protein